MHFLLDEISPEKILILLINFICVLNTSWDIYAILVGSFPNTGLDGKYNCIALPHYIGYPPGKCVLSSIPCAFSNSYTSTG